MTLPRPPSRLKRGHPSPYPTPFGTDPPSALAMRPPQNSSQIYAYDCLGEPGHLPISPSLLPWQSSLICRIGLVSRTFVHEDLSYQCNVFLDAMRRLLSLQTAVEGILAARVFARPLRVRMGFDHFYYYLFCSFHSCCWCAEVVHLDFRASEFGCPSLWKCTESTSRDMRRMALTFQQAF